MKTLILKYLLGNYQAKLLSVVPANGYKSFISLIATLLAVLTAMLSGAEFTFTNMFQWLGELLGMVDAKIVLSPAEITTMCSAMLTVLGLWHKVLKRLQALSLVLLFLLPQFAYADVLTESRTISSAVVVTSDAASSTVYVPNCDKGLRIDVVVTNNSGTNPTIDIKAQDTPDGTVYYDLPEATFTQVTTGTALTQSMHLNKTIMHPLSRVRLYYDTGGTNPNYTVSAYLRHACR